jgi:hypothetical protein
MSQLANAPVIPEDHHAFHPPFLVSATSGRQPRKKKPQIGYGTMSRGPRKTEIHCEIVEIRIIVDCIKYEMNNCNTLSLFIFFILGENYYPPRENKS